jgi:hypothetical protein
MGENVLLFVMADHLIDRLLDGALFLSRSIPYRMTLIVAPHYWVDLGILMVIRHQGMERREYRSIFGSSCLFIMDSITLRL